jgi:membrane fusion protein, multidrug efflux system
MTTLTAQSPSTVPKVLERTEAAPPSAPAKPIPRALIVLPSLALVAGGIGITGFLLGRGKETTDDAQVEGHVANVSPRVAGQVLHVLVKDNQLVHVGDVLVELDARDLTARLAAANADLAAARAQLHASETQLAVTAREVESELTVAQGGIAQATAVGGTTRAAIAQANADIAVADAQRTLAQSELERSANLLKTGAQSQAQYDARKAALDQADATLSQARARLASAESNLGNSAGTLQNARGRLIAAQSGPQRIEAARAQVELGRARVDQAQAALDQAALNHEYTQIRAEISGVVSRRSVEVGQMVSPDRPLMALVPLDDTWVIANFKEDQIAEIRAGARAQVRVDTFAGKKLRGHVESLASGTGARFSLLPPDNASGNFTKVVQRVPVLIRLDPHAGVELRPGLSATATVDTAN